MFHPRAGTVLASAAAVLTLSAPAFAQAADEQIEQYIEQVDTPAAVVEQIQKLEQEQAERHLYAFPPTTSPTTPTIPTKPTIPTIPTKPTITPTRPDDGGGVDLQSIVNVGKQVWQVIQDNQPVVTIAHDYATALPKGITESAELSDFSDLQYQSYRLQGVNYFGMTVYDVTYTLVHQYGGNLEGKGKYLATVGIIPSNVDVIWGYTVDMGVTRVSATNVGTALAPIGSVNMEMSFTVHTMMKHHTTTTLYQFRGDTAEINATSF